MQDFIQEKEIFLALQRNQNLSKEKIRAIINKSKKLKGLSFWEVAALLNCHDKKLIRLMFKTANEVKEEIYGRRLVLFAPLYLSNKCSNNCSYCGFRIQNKGLKRKQLATQEIKKEVEALVKEGHKRVLLVAGEHKDSGIAYIDKAVKAVYSIKIGGGQIRRVNVNVAPLSVKNFKRLKKTGIGTYQLFQETYHHATYKAVHPSGRKSDYLWRLFAMDRAQQAGIDDVGLGVLFGLYDYRFEVLALMQHSKHLEGRFGVGPHTISIPRIEPALNAPLANKPPHPLSEEDFKKVVAIIRMAVPYTGIILSTRERASLRDQLFGVGVSQISAGSKTFPGGYATKKNSFQEAEQFQVGDSRTIAETIRDASKAGFYPSFCTACYRVGRTGKDFMDLAKPGEIKKFCLPNCILTYKEYLLDYGTKELKTLGEGVISEELGKITDKKIRLATIKKLGELKKGKRDLYF